MSERSAASVPTAIEKIISAHAGREVAAGEFCTVDVDLVMATDGNAPLAIRLLREELLSDSVAAPDKVVLVVDHCGPSPNERASNLQKGMHEFARDTGVRIFSAGEGISHVLLPEQGLLRPGMLVLGSDSHSVTYGAVNCVGVGMGSTDIAVAMKTGRTWLRVPETIRVNLHAALRSEVSAKDLALHLVRLIGVDGATYCCLEIAGPGLATLDMDDRLTICNMSIEVGAKCSLMPCDAELAEYLAARSIACDTSVELSDDATFATTYEVDLGAVEVLVAPPHDLSRIDSADRFSAQRIDMAFIGTCTNSRIGDLRVAAEVLRGKRIAPDIRLVVSPGSRDVYLQALREGLMDVFVSAGGIVTPPGCGPCVGTHMGVPADGEVILSTANRNFKGRMGNPNASIFLASPRVVALSAVAGHIAGGGEAD